MTILDWIHFYEDPRWLEMCPKKLHIYIFSFYVNITLLDFRTLHEMCSNLSSFCLLHQAKMEILGFCGWMFRQIVLCILEERKKKYRNVIIIKLMFFHHPKTRSTKYINSMFYSKTKTNPSFVKCESVSQPTAVQQADW